MMYYDIMAVQSHEEQPSYQYEENPEGDYTEELPQGMPSDEAEPDNIYGTNVSFRNTKWSNFKSKNISYM